MSQPLVSIFMFCKDRRESIARAIDSVLAQSWPHIEIIVQDAASTDGTLEILQAYGGAIDLVSAPDSGPAEGFNRALQRCRGAYIGSCLSDEELLPDAVERAVAYLDGHPQAGAITGDADIIDFNGKIIGEYISKPFILVPYLTGEYCPFFVSSFFRRQALVEVGIMDSGWQPTSIEFEMWCRLGADTEIHYVSGKFGRYGIHPGQLSNVPSDIQLHMDGRFKVIERMFTPGGLFASPSPDCAALMYHLLARQCVNQFNHVMCHKLPAAGARYWELFVLYSRRLGQVLAAQAGCRYDDARLVALVAAEPSVMFRDDALATIAAHLDAGPAVLEALGPLAIPDAMPARIELPRLPPALHAVALAELERYGQRRALSTGVGPQGR
ncbi:MAG TPA: glycosyltransferase [Patescibacteria group bacterium]|nr:glycosyltransferase [Patescibacteria group bacterium]